MIYNTNRTFKDPLNIKPGWLSVLILSIFLVFVSVYKVAEFSNAKVVPGESLYEVEVNRTIGGRNNSMDGTLKYKEKIKVNALYFLVPPLMLLALLILRIALRQLAPAVFIMNEKIDGTVWLLISVIPYYLFSKLY